MYLPTAFGTVFFLKDKVIEYKAKGYLLYLLPWNIAWNNNYYQYYIDAAYYYTFTTSGI